MSSGLFLWVLLALIIGVVASIVASAALAYDNYRIMTIALSVLLICILLGSLVCGALDSIKNAEEIRSEICSQQGGTPEGNKCIKDGKVIDIESLGK